MVDGVEVGGLVIIIVWQAPDPELCENLWLGMFFISLHCVHGISLLPFVRECENSSRAAPQQYLQKCCACLADHNWAEFWLLQVLIQSSFFAMYLLSSISSLSAQVEPLGAFTTLASWEQSPVGPERNSISIQPTQRDMYYSAQSHYITWLIHFRIN